MAPPDRISGIAAAAEQLATPYTMRFVLIEAESIPYEASQLRGERLLVLAPHPDDEVIGCGGLVALHLRERREVRVLIATDGAEAGSAATREEESRRGITRLGAAAVEFLRLPDRALDASAGPRLREHLLDFAPDLVLVPSPAEIHPDHAALARVFCELLQSDDTLFADLAVARVAFYEVSQPIRPNAIVDISEVAEQKYAAIGEHQSQTALRDYAHYARGLNAYRAMTLPPETKFAEAYYVTELSVLRTTPVSELRKQLGAPPEIEVSRNLVPLTVIVRTKDRPQLLLEAVDSIRATGYPCEIVVVNDGGEALPGLGEDASVIEHDTSQGRAQAGNAGARSATTPFIAFLDDDDLFYPEHLDTLTRAASSSHVAWYSDAVSAFLRPGEDGAYATYSRLRLFAHDFDRQLLLIDNYIPLPTLLLRREAFYKAGGFDPAFDLFEDWDLLIRLSLQGDFLRIPRLTCEIRHFEGGSSAVLASPEGSDRFRSAKLQVWKKHEHLVTPEVIAGVTERQKRRIGHLYSELIEARGQVNDLRTTLARTGREQADLQYSSNGHMLRVRELEGAVAALSGMAADYAAKTESLQALGSANRELHEELERSRVEIRRLGGLLDMIYRSRTWKVHNVLEKIRGRG
jgi:LmbE family N-acetylglucosaminyl deacetylase/GT2 family glycosyltransferase